MPKYSKNIQDMCLFDNEFMTAVFSNKKLAELLIRIILKKNDLKIISSKTQYDIKNLFGRSVRLDILAVDSSGTYYNIEIQRDSGGAHKKRARYNISLIDAQSIEAGEDVKNLPEVYMIFITEHDVLGEGKAIYRINRRIDGSRKIFDDGAHIIYVNGEKKNNTKLGRLMSDFACKDPSEFYYKEIGSEVNYYKNDEKGVTDMSEIVERIVKAENEAVLRNKSIKVALSLIELEKLSIDEIAKCSELSLDEVRSLEKRYREGRLT